ncbi:MAG: DUF1990 family protein [Acidimicrobiales bacterium]
MTKVNGLELRFGSRPKATELDDLLAGLAGVPVTYTHVGSTLEPDRRPSVRCTTLKVGSGRAAFDQAVTGLRRWLPQRGVGARVHPPDAPLRVGTDLVVALRVGPVTVLAPNRIVAVVDEPDRLAFAYGSLPGIPRAGRRASPSGSSPTARCSSPSASTPGRRRRWCASPTLPSAGSSGAPSDGTSEP